MLQRMKATIEKQWRTLLLFMGVAALPDLFKEFFRAKAMDWMAAKLGPVGMWLVANPAGFLTVALICVLVALSLLVIVEAVWPPSSVILDANERPFNRIGMSDTWTLRFGLVTGLILILVAYGSYRYYAYTHRPPAPASPMHLALSTSPIPFNDLVPLKKGKDIAPHPCSLKGRKSYQSLEELPGGRGYKKPYLVIEPKTLLLQQTADRKDDVELFMEVTVVNRGESSIAKDWKLCFFSGDQVHWYGAEQVTEENKIDFHANQPMPDVTSQPIEHGKAVRGWFLFYVPGNLMKDWTYAGGLKCRDYLEHEYETTFGPS
jgi:hypothetical protein